ncbi:Deoxyribonuclease-2-alpha [Chelonia mydas]|uniref:Deoxyribonuclease-2-alpha n=1 Tax=Chelonia mydas TaxID=8469 RepID=M7BNE1_CHEMY|nr:Deoxyribonuclease-2-alpha [Chelonia mydas]
MNQRLEAEARQSEAGNKQFPLIARQEKENQRLAETIQELEGKVSKQREWEKTHKQALQQLRVQEDELQRHLWDMEAKRRAKADRIREPPKNVPSSTSPRGHTKGVVLLDRAQGFWLLHSTPHYPPPVTETYAWPHSGLHNGQSFLCVTFPYAQFNEIDLYSGWVAQALSSDLYVQFWPNSRGVLPSNCSGPYRVYNIEELGFPAPGPDFPATVDHSKWCVSTESTPGWACVGDMNRNLEEEQRGGGTLCQQDPAVWKSYYALVQKYSKC